MLKRITRSKVVYCVIGFIILALAGVIITSTYVGIEASSGSPMPNYMTKELVDEEGKPNPLGSAKNPYTIVEIVPDKDSAMIGYLIDGQEPRDLLSIGAQYNSNPESTDIGPNSATGIYKEAFASEISPGSVVSEPDEETGKLPILSIFNKDKDTIKVKPEPYFVEKTDKYSGEAATDNVAYSQYGYFYKVQNGTGYYKYEDGIFKPAEGTSGNFNWKCLGHFKYVGYGKGTCNRLTDGRGFSYDTSKSEGNVGSDAIKYEYSMVGDFVWEPSLAFAGENIFAENQTEITYMDGDQTKSRPISEAELGDAVYMTRTEDKFYEYSAYEITCKDPFIKNFIGENASSLNYAMQVVTVTPDELIVDDNNGDEAKKARDLIDMVDMIIIHDCETGYRIAKSLDGQPSYSAPTFGEGARKDLTAKTVEAIIERGASGYTTNEMGVVTSKPAAIVFDEVAIEAAENNSCPNLKTLYDVYNNLGAKLAYNWKKGQSYISKVSDAVPADKRFGYGTPDALGKSNFVYNFVGDDDSWLTSAFTYKEKIERTTFNDSAFFNLDTYDEEHPERPSTLDPTMSVATMLMAIDRETYGIHQSNKLDILELQPNEQYYYDESRPDDWVMYYVSLFPWFVGTSKDIVDDVNVDRMATYQFIGRNEDLNENYDLILIGNNKQDETNGQNTGKPGYNYDSYGPQLSYTAVGDQVTREDSTNGYKSNLRYSGNDLTKKKYDQIMEFAKQAPVIVDDKLYDNQMSSQSRPNTYIVDNSSFVYQIADKNVDDSEPFINKHAEGVWNPQKAVLVKNSMTVENISLDFTKTLYGKDGFPTEYENRNDSYMNNNQQRDSAGNNILQYHFVLNGSDESNYKINLYTDINGDGIFEGCISHSNEIDANIDKINDADKYNEAKAYSEKSSNLVIFDETDKYEVNEKDFRGGVLLNNHTYLVTKILPDSDVGLIPWKLEVYNIGNDSIRFSKIGYTRIKTDGSSGSKPAIRVLQMCTTPDMKSNGKPYVVFDSNYVFFEALGYRLENTVANHFDQFANVPGGDFSRIKVDYMENYSQDKQTNANIKPWYEQFNGKPKEWTNFLLNNYDMLIIGCRDEAKFTTNETFLQGFEEFRKAGKAIILTHDLVEDYSLSSDVTNDVRYYLRDISGQLRKYYNAVDVANNGSKQFYYDRFWTLGKELSAIYSPLDYDTYVATGSRMVRDYLDSKGGYMHANMIMDNSNRVMLTYNKYGGGWLSSEKYNYIDRKLIGKKKFDDRSGIEWNSGTFETTSIIPANEGKITKYPYNISGVLTTRPTHTQNYQLDLEYDEDGDVMVWYDLYGPTDTYKNGGIYTTRLHDARNNYYIYSKGNIMYTSMGHTEGSYDIKSIIPLRIVNIPAIGDDEIKLFINTMIAAYRSSASDPYITVTNAAAAKNGNTSTVYLEDREFGYDISNLNNENNTADYYPLRFRIDDDTTNTKIERNYKIQVYGIDSAGNETFLWEKDGAERSKEYVIDSTAGEPDNSRYNYTYDNVKLNETLRYKVVLTSSGIDRSKNKPLKETESVKYINVQLMPMFGMR